MNTRALTTALLVTATAFALGCGSTPMDAPYDGDEVSEEEALSTKVAPGEFRLYAEPSAIPSEFCNVFTQLTLSNTKGARADFEEKLEGTCRMAVAPNPRYYRLKLAGTSCGSQIYKGSYKKSGTSHAVTITDHRTRTCRDIVPAKIVVEESHKGAEGTSSKTLYSYDTVAADPIDAALINDANPAWSGSELKAADLEKALQPYLPAMQFMSESDDAVHFASADNPAGAAYTDTTVRVAFASALKSTVYADYDYDVAKDLGSEMSTPNDTKKLLRGLEGDGPEWASAIDILAKNVKGLRLVKIGPGTESGFLKIDAGRYVYVFVGRTVDGKLAGIFFGATET